MYGLTEGGALAASPDVQGMGSMTWAEMVGVAPGDPLIGGGPAGTGGVGRFDADARFGHVVSTMPGNDPAVADQGADLFDDWRDLFDFRNSPAPYVLALALAAIGFIQLRMVARAGGARADLRLG